MSHPFLKFIAMLAVCSGSAAAAQDIGGYQAWGQTYVTIGINAAMMDAATGPGQDDEDAAPAPVAQPASLTFTPSLTRRRANLADFVTKTKAVDPVGARMLEEAFAGGDFIDQVGAGISQYGLQTDNFADAYTLYWISAWQAANADYRDVTRAQAQAVKRQAEEAILSTAEFADTGDAEKQKLSEAYIIQAVQIGQAQELAKNDRDFEQKLASAVRQGASKSGFETDAVTLTDQGFVAVKVR